MSFVFVKEAMRDAVIAPLDDRGLMPLERARAIVQGASEFRKGQGRMIPGAGWVLDSDILWAALMSLEDTSEFVREATRIRWFFHPRSQGNVAPLERYGEGVLPWLSTFVRPDGRFVDVPWCVRPCLMHIAREEVFELLWRATCVSDGIGDEWPGPFAADNAGDADRRSGTHFDEPGAAQPDDAANALVIDWIDRNPAVGFPALARRATHDARARLMLKSLAQSAPSETFAHVRAALGEAPARALFDATGTPAALDESCVLVTLDAGQWSEWPALYGPRPERAYHAMRLVAARSRQGERWGVVFERIEGDDFESAALVPYCFGSSVAPGPRAVDDLLPFRVVDGPEEAASPFDLEGVRVEGPRGPLVLSNAMLEAFELRPGRATADGVASSRFSLMLRAYLTAHPGAFFGDPRAAASLLGLGDDAEILVVSEAFQHCLSGLGPVSYPAAWLAPPSASPVYRSLARAVLARDGARFEPGEPNLDFRLHALADTGESRGDA